MSDYIFGTLKILKRVTQKKKELITSNTSDRTTIHYEHNTTIRNTHTYRSTIPTNVDGNKDVA